MSALLVGHKAHPLPLALQSGRAVVTTPSKQAADKATASPVPSTVERKTAIWAAATVTGQARNSPVPLHKPMPQQPATAAAIGSSADKSAGQTTEHLSSASSAPVTPQSEGVTMTYVRRPALDAAGRATGGMEIVPASAAPAETNTGKTVSSNVVAASEALSRAVGKPGAAPKQPGAMPNQPGASSDEAEATPDRSGAERNMGQASSSTARASLNSPGASSGSPRAGEGSAEEGWKRSKQERSSSWKTG